MNTALITGASTGIGKEYVYGYAQKGYDIILVSRSENKLEKIAEDIVTSFGVKAFVIPMDLSEEGASKRVYEKVKELNLQVNLLINNAGAGTTGELLEHSLEKNHQQVMLNVHSVVQMTQLFLSDMKEQQSGTIINVASMAAFQPIPYMSIYAATKAFVLSFSEGLHEEYKKYGIHIMAVCPGNTSTDFFNEAPNAIKVGKMRTPSDVFRSTVRGVQSKKSFVIDAKSNQVTSLLPRLLPRRIVSKISGDLMKKSMKD